MNKLTLHILLLTVCIALLSACKVRMEPVDDSVGGTPIVVGASANGLSTSVEITRAAGDPQDAETVPWLVQPLKQGLDITYGNINNGEHQNTRVAILKLQPADGGTIEDEYYKIDPRSGYAVYTFNYRGADGQETSDPAVWYDNGLHFFEGVHVPYRLRYVSNPSELETDNRTVHDKSGLAAVHNLTTDQHDDNATGTDNQLGNYTLLAHYLGMPANTQIAATVARIKLPFRHRLARVLAYILIDPELKNGNEPTKILGYKNIETDPSKPFRDDPTTSSIRFCNVDVLGGVHDVYNTTTKIHTLTPYWSEKVRKVVPHFSEQKDTVIVYEKEDKTLYPGNNGYDEVHHAAGHSGYKQVVYHAVPVYDLIVRPTYTTVDNVMYDEDLSGGKTKEWYVTKKNNIDFLLSLDNGLTYQKEFEFDLDANFQTIVYLKISREGVDYNESGSEKWVESVHNDKWYGLDNDNGHTLSKAGSSWQRAFYNTHLGDDDKITDGGFYDEDTPGEDGTLGQYISTETWLRYFSEAYQGGEHHGDYFVLAKDITIDASTLPSDGLVFTGHLDGFNTHSERGYHTITLTGAGGVTPCSATATDVLNKLYDDAAGTNPVPQLYRMEEVAQTPARRTGSIPAGTPRAYDMETTYPADIVADAAAGLLIYCQDEEGNYVLYENRTFYKRAPSFLFAGLDGVYSTRQEDEKAAGRPIYNQPWAWEANVHWSEDRKCWIPYRDVSDPNPSKHSGWRAEVVNLQVVGGTLFRSDAVITGYVQNCTEQTGDASTRRMVEDHIPAYPKYK